MVIKAQDLTETFVEGASPAEAVIDKAVALLNEARISGTQEIISREALSAVEENALTILQSVLSGMGENALFKPNDKIVKTITEILYDACADHIESEQELGETVSRLMDHQLWTAKILDDGLNAAEKTQLAADMAESFRWHMRDEEMAPLRSKVENYITLDA